MDLICKGKLSHIFKVKDLQNHGKEMAAKISKLKKFETDNAKNEVRILKELGDMTMRSIDGY